MSGAVAEFSDDNFESEVLNSDKPVLVDFWAPWCGPCRQIAPLISQLAEQNPHIKVGKVNVDESPVTAGQYEITSIPTLILFRDGKVCETTMGIPRPAVVQQLLEAART
jgi:thioredoxin 1